MLMKDTVKMINARIQINIRVGEYWVMKNPVSIATSRKDITKKNKRTPHLYF